MMLTDDEVDEDIEALLYAQVYYGKSDNTSLPETQQIDVSLNKEAPIIETGHSESLVARNSDDISTDNEQSAQDNNIDFVEEPDGKGKDFEPNIDSPSKEPPDNTLESPNANCSKSAQQYLEISTLSANIDPADKSPTLGPTQIVAQIPLLTAPNNPQQQLLNNITINQYINYPSEKFLNRLKVYKEQVFWSKQCERDLKRLQKGKLTEANFFKILTRRLKYQKNNLRKQEQIRKAFFKRRQKSAPISEVICLSDSDNSDVEIIESPIVNANRDMASKDLESISSVEFGNDDEDEIIYVPPPPVPIINVEDESGSDTDIQEAPDIEPQKPPHEADDASNDFLAPTNSSENFNFSLHGSEFRDAEFVRPVNPTDTYETESSTSTSELNRELSNSVKTIVFNEVDFPKDDIFEGSGLEKFGELITPKRVGGDVKEATSEEHKSPKGRKRGSRKASSISSSESDYDGTQGVHTNLPDLSPMVCAEVSPRKKRKNKTSDRTTRSMRSSRFTQENDGIIDAETSERTRRSKRRSSGPAMEDDAPRKKLKKKKKKLDKDAVALAEHEAASEAANSESSEKSLQPEPRLSNSEQPESSKKKSKKKKKQAKEADAAVDNDDGASDEHISINMLYVHFPKKEPYDERKNNPYRRRHANETNNVPKETSDDSVVQTVIDKLVDSERKRVKKRKRRRASGEKQVADKNKNLAAVTEDSQASIFVEDHQQDNDNESHTEDTINNADSEKIIQESIESTGPVSAEKQPQKDKLGDRGRKSKSYPKRKRMSQSKAKEIGTIDKELSTLVTEGCEGSKPVEDQQDNNNEETTNVDNQKVTGEPIESSESVLVEQQTHKDKLNDRGRKSKSYPKRKRMSRSKAKEIGTSDKELPTLVTEDCQVAEPVEEQQDNNNEDNNKSPTEETTNSNVDNNQKVTHESIESSTEPVSVEQQTTQQDNLSDRGRKSYPKRKRKSRSKAKEVGTNAKEIPSLVTEDCQEDQQETNKDQTSLVNRTEEAETADNETVAEEPLEDGEIVESPKARPGEKVTIETQEDDEEDVILIEQVIPVHTIESSDTDDDVISLNDVGDELQLANISSNVKVDDNSKEIDEFDIAYIQSKMSDDPEKWKIHPTDLYTMNVGKKGRRCNKCRQFGHIAIHCPNKRDAPNCALCGSEGHEEPRCPNRVCFTCAKPGSYSTVVCFKCAKHRNATCTVCKLQGHSARYCSDVWRRYFLTTREGPLVRPKPSNFYLRRREKQWCSGCGKKGHFEFECTNWLREYPVSSPRIFGYEDLYEIARRPPRKVLRLDTLRDLAADKLLRQKTIQASATATQQSGTPSISTIPSKGDSQSQDSPLPISENQPENTADQQQAAEPPPAINPDTPAAPEPPIVISNTPSGREPPIVGPIPSILDGLYFPRPRNTQRGGKRKRSRAKLNPASMVQGHGAFRGYTPYNSMLDHCSVPANNDGSGQFSDHSFMGNPPQAGFNLYNSVPNNVLSQQISNLMRSVHAYRTHNMQDFSQSYTGDDGQYDYYQNSQYSDSQIPLNPTMHFQPPDSINYNMSYSNPFPVNEGNYNFMSAQTAYGNRDYLDVPYTITREPSEDLSYYNRGPPSFVNDNNNSFTRNDFQPEPSYNNTQEGFLPLIPGQEEIVDSFRPKKFNNVEEATAKKFTNLSIEDLITFLSSELEKLDAVKNADPKMYKKKLNNIDQLQKIEVKSNAVKKQMYFLYKHLNMFLFGIQKLDDGKKNLDFLRNFLYNPGRVLSDSKKSALLEAYGYIFGGEHPNFNYRRHLNAMTVGPRRGKYAPC